MISLADRRWLIQFVDWAFKTDIWVVPMSTRRNHSVIFPVSPRGLVGLRKLLDQFEADGNIGWFNAGHPTDETEARYEIWFEDLTTATVAKLRYRSGE